MLLNASPYPWFVRGWCGPGSKTPWVRCDHDYQYETCLANMKARGRRLIKTIYAKTSDGFRVRWDFFNGVWNGPNTY